MLLPQQRTFPTILCFFNAKYVPCTFELQSVHSDTDRQDRYKKRPCIKFYGAGLTSR